MKRKTRIDEITFLSSFGMILIVLGHSRPAPEPPNVLGAGLFYTIADIFYTFHVPLFFFVSGFLFIYTTRNTTGFDYLAFLKKKVKRLLLPYFLLNTVAFLIKAPLTSYAWNPKALNLTSYFESLVYPSGSAIGYFWFLPTLFLIFTLAPILRSICLSNKTNWYVYITLLLIALHFSSTLIHIKTLNVSGALNYVIYFWSGMLFFVYRKNMHTRHNLTACLLCGALVLFFYFTVDSMDLRLFFCSFCGILMSYYLIIYYTANGLSWLSIINGYSYQIYLLSWFPQAFFRLVMYQEVKVGFWESVLCMFLGGLFLPVLATRIVKRFVPRLGFVVGQELRCHKYSTRAPDLAA